MMKYMQNTITLAHAVQLYAYESTAQQNMTE